MHMKGIFDRNVASFLILGLFSYMDCNLY